MIEQQDDNIVEELGGILSDQADSASQRVVQAAIDGIETRDVLLNAMNDFIRNGDCAEAFEETLDDETQEMYRTHFNLQPEVRGLRWPSGFDDDE